MTIPDLSIVVAGWHGTAPREFWGMNMELLSNTLQVMGSDASYRFERVSVDGGATTGTPTTGASRVMQQGR